MPAWRVSSFEKPQSGSASSSFVRSPPSGCAGSAGGFQANSRTHSSSAPACAASASVVPAGRYGCSSRSRSELSSVSVMRSVAAAAVRQLSLSRSRPRRASSLSECACRSSVPEPAPSCSARTRTSIFSPSSAGRPASPPAQGTRLCVSSSPSARSKESGGIEPCSSPVRPGTSPCSTTCGESGRSSCVSSLSAQRPPWPSEARVSEAPSSSVRPSSKDRVQPGRPSSRFAEAPARRSSRSAPRRGKLSWTPWSVKGCGAMCSLAFAGRPGASWRSIHAGGGPKRSSSPRPLSPTKLPCAIVPCRPKSRLAECTIASSVPPARLACPSARCRSSARPRPSVRYAPRPSNASSVAIERSWTSIRASTTGSSPRPSALQGSTQRRSACRLPASPAIRRASSVAESGLPGPASSRQAIALSAGCSWMPRVSSFWNPIGPGSVSRASTSARASSACQPTRASSAASGSGRASLAHSSFQGAPEADQVKLDPSGRSGSSALARKSRGSPSSSVKPRCSVQRSRPSCTRPSSTRCVCSDCSAQEIVPELGPTSASSKERSKLGPRTCASRPCCCARPSSIALEKPCTLPRARALPKARPPCVRRPSTCASISSFPADTPASSARASKRAGCPGCSARRARSPRTSKAWPAARVRASDQEHSGLVSSSSNSGSDPAAAVVAEDSGVPASGFPAGARAARARSRFVTPCSSATSVAPSSARSVPSERPPPRASSTRLGSSSSSCATSWPCGSKRRTPISRCIPNQESCALPTSSRPWKRSANAREAKPGTSGAAIQGRQPKRSSRTSAASSAILRQPRRNPRRVLAFGAGSFTRASSPTPAGDQVPDA